MIWTVAAGVFLGLLLWALRGWIFVLGFWAVLISLFVLGLLVAGGAGYAIGATGLGDLWYHYGNSWLLLLTFVTAFSAFYPLSKVVEDEELQWKQYLLLLGLLFVTALPWGLNNKWDSEKRTAERCVAGEVRYSGVSYCESADRRLVEEQRERETRREQRRAQQKWQGKSVRERKRDYIEQGLAASPPESELASPGRTGIQAPETGNHVPESPIIRGWTASRNVASAADAGARVSVRFPMDGEGQALLVLQVRSAVGVHRMHVTVDGKDFGDFLATPACADAACWGFLMPSQLLGAVKNGSVLTIRYETREGFMATGIDLTGSARALNLAYGFTVEKSGGDSAGPPIRKGLPYSQVRSALLEAGYRPYPVPRIHDPGSFSREREMVRKRGWHEVESCAGTGSGLCRFRFTTPANGTLLVVTAGEHDDPSVYTWWEE